MAQGQSQSRKRTLGDILRCPYLNMCTCRIQFDTRLTDIKVSFIGGVLVTLEDPVYDKDDSGKVIQASFQHNDSYDNDVDK